MYRPNRIGPWPCADIEIPLWDMGGTLSALIDNGGLSVILGAVRSVTVPNISNVESIVITAETFTPASASLWAVGCLISGVNPDPANNILYSISGQMRIDVGTADVRGSMMPIISKLDATPTDPDVAITITDYICLPMQAYSHAAQMHNGSVNTQIVVGDIRGSTASQSNLPIFVGWAFYSTFGGAYSVNAHGAINVHKHLEDIQTQDPQR